VVTDRGYDSVRDIVAGMEAGMDIHVAGRDYDICVPTEESGAVIREHKEGRCAYNGERNIVLCPMGQVLYPAFYKEGKGKVSGEFALLFLAYNKKRVINILEVGNLLQAFGR
jgi:hypothetical protein